MYFIKIFSQFYPSKGRSTRVLITVFKYCFVRTSCIFKGLLMSLKMKKKIIVVVTRTSSKMLQLEKKPPN